MADSGITEAATAQFPMVRHAAEVGWTLLSPRAFGVHWALKDDAGLRTAGIATLDLAQRTETLLDRFPNAGVNADEQRRLRAALYAPLLGLDSDARRRMVERIVTILLRTDADANV